MRPLTLGLLREVAETGDASRLALWAAWMPPRPRRLRQACVTHMVLPDFAALLQEAIPSKGPEPGVRAAADAWRSLANSAHYLAFDLAWHFGWTRAEVWECPLGEAYRFACDAGWHDAVRAFHRAQASGGGGGRMPTRPEPHLTPPKPVDPTQMAAARAAMAAHKAAEDG